MNKTKVTFNALTDRFEYDLERLIVLLATKKPMMEVLFLPVMMYRCESWTEKEQNGKKMIKYIRVRFRDQVAHWSNEGKTKAVVHWPCSDEMISWDRKGEMVGLFNSKQEERRTWMEWKNRQLGLFGLYYASLENDISIRNISETRQAMYSTPVQQTQKHFIQVKNA